MTFANEDEHESVSIMLSRFLAGMTA